MDDRARVITSKSNEKVKALREGLRGRASEPGELVTVEGPKLLEEAFRAGLAVEALFVREGWEAGLADVLHDDAERERTYVLSEAVFASVMDTRSPQPVAALVRIPEGLPARVDGLRGMALLVESVQDPGNLGTLLRSAEAFGAEMVLLASETVNPWSPKVMRASAGSVFRVPVLRLASVAEVRRPGVTAYAAMAQGAFVTSLLETRLQFPCVLMVGNEGAGLSAEAVAMAQTTVWIPCATESLNAGVAGSLLLYEAMRQRGGL